MHIMPKFILKKWVISQGNTVTLITSLHTSPTLYLHIPFFYTYGQVTWLKPPPFQQVKMNSLNVWSLRHKSRFPIRVFTKVTSQWVRGSSDTLQITYFLMTYGLLFRRQTIYMSEKADCGAKLPGFKPIFHHFNSCVTSNVV